MAAMKVLIADDHRLVRDGLRASLEGQDDFVVVGEAGDGNEAVLRARELKPDLVLMDLEMPGTSGIDACQEIRDILPDTKVLILTAASNRESVVGSLLAGAQGYLLKLSGEEDLLRSLRAIGRGETILDPAVAGMIAEGFTEFVKGENQREVEQLTPREKEALVLIGQGSTNKEIAAELVISEFTARNMVSNILGKLGLKNRAELVAWAFEHDIIPRG